MANSYKRKHKESMNLDYDVKFMLVEHDHSFHLIIDSK